ncbi:iron complex transport system ATP-binding protein [Rhizobium leguminosarum]|uniref:Iron complex transport system ATP-binding protein n=1 Tax=Rhizobium leguminosarum TaxID=384 RepID=A0AAE2MN00_RHILE|nr:MULTISPECIES: ATP-binding cassette domain-containing protein [Rhizobium]MBB4292311.1 iron complex transport system ATP-binding protein [Rhizobium leguminosarum]MBB4299860.1 iron complex transport system ATP-binding protein [Rhizobium leguminosarum]MBB4309751.1 iron complex transport system ATP-binding protein [Rhizobium leguminosarum]MBB4419509.1 iron complex transport system ATP-binding protein [Rhizobium leguminosarum]MBB4434312.1 iron complex transport system ATP-binding protein [Rhizobi
MPSPFLALSGITYAIGPKPILRGIDLTLEQGRIYGLVGPNGSGKSTLLKIIARQVGPQSGAIAFAGKPTADWGAREFARHVAYMPQFTPATDGMTVRELVALGRFPWHGTLGRFTTTDRNKVEEAIARTKLEDFADRLVANMSGGERQRAWIAMMLAQDARCLLLDEPTSALDLAHQASVLSLVQELSHERGLTVVIVLHDINLAARYCDAIVALNRGRIAAEGTPAEIMQTDTLRSIFGVGMGVFPHPVRNEPVSYLL